MDYTIDLIETNNGKKYRVTLWNGKVSYVGNRFYATVTDASKAARSAINQTHSGVRKNIQC